MNHFSYGFDNQQAFDYVVKFMFDQNRKATIEPGSAHCMYRAADGAKCAAGCLLPDEAIKNDGDDKWNDTEFAYEGRTINEKIIDHWLPKVDYLLISNLQYCHDNCKPEQSNFRNAFYNMVKEMIISNNLYNLNFSFFEELYKDYK